MAGDYSGGLFRLVVLRPGGGENMKRRGPSAPVSPVPASGTVTLPSSLPIRVGDLIGLNIATGKQRDRASPPLPPDPNSGPRAAAEPGDIAQKIGGGGLNLSSASTPTSRRHARRGWASGSAPRPMHRSEPRRQEARGGQEKPNKANWKLGRRAKKERRDRETGKVRKQSPSGEGPDGGVEGDGHPRSHRAKRRRSPCRSRRASSARSAGVGRGSCWLGELVSIGLPNMRVARARPADVDRRAARAPAARGGGAV